ncbi:MAG: hypothetical protein GY808_11000 [Gammaproteobacteria bacterium]|nr:hypothetical protein [Gammaproteobacteria bacterium]
MAKGYAVLVGLKSVDPLSYNGWDGINGCWGCELDVDNMDRILKSVGYQTNVIKTAAATRDNILSALYRAAENMTNGDIFVFYYSGHGGQQPDFNGDEMDGKDETLVAYDREVIDDKIHNALEKFATGVRIVMISDSCNSGTNYRGIRTINANENGVFRPVARNSNKDLNIKAQLIHLSGCRDGFTSAGYEGGGAFTMALCVAWQNGAFKGNFKNFHSKICKVIRSSQKPQYSEYGPVSDDYRNQGAFDIQVIPKDDTTTELPVIETEPVNADISDPGEKHNYKFSAKNAGKYKIETEGRTDISMSLYGPNDQSKLVSTDDDSGTGLNAKIETDLTPGTYYVRVQHYNSNSGTGAYGIRVSRSGS